MVYCVQAELAFSNAVRRDDILADIQAFIAGQPRWGIDILRAQVLKQGPFGIRAALRFTTQANEQALLAHIQNAATGQRTPLPGSWVQLHDCTHDDGTNDCTVTNTVTW